MRTAAVWGVCDLDANCFFLNPITLPLGNIAACIMNVVATDVCGSADLANNQFNLAINVSSRIYVRQGCPKCVNGTCNDGDRAGLSCTGGVGSTKTTIECPPFSRSFVGREAINFSGLSSGTTTWTSPDGLFCPGQVGHGAFGGEAGTIRETGSPIFSGGPSTFDTTFARHPLRAVDGQFPLRWDFRLAGSGGGECSGVGTGLFGVRRVQHALQPVQSGAALRDGVPTVPDVPPLTLLDDAPEEP